jgi:hypothetical protein
MRSKHLVACFRTLFLLSMCAASLAGQVPRRTNEQIKASYEAHKNDFDYLLGDWAFTAVNRQYGNMRGYWSAVRLEEGGQIVDEYRIVGENGETYYSTTTLRAFNAVLDQWELISTDKDKGLQDFGTGHLIGGEMRIEQKFGVMTPNPSLWRIRYHDIGADSFSWSADRSKDNGRTWEKNFQQLEAKRIGPSRSIGPLAPARKPTAAAPAR